MPNRDKMGAPACVDCHAVPCITTSQCTDQCVVVACSDDDPICEMECPGGHCDLVCEDASNCKDCNGFDEFLQCCTDFHSYYEEPRNNTSETPWAWDSSLKTFVCPCGGGSTMDCLPTNSAIPEADSGFPPMDDTAISTPISSATPPPAALDSQSSSILCMWGDCGASFTGLADLAEHVNLIHLCHPLTPTLPMASESELRDLACRWKDCDVYPTADLIPGPSSGGTDSMLCLLASHLLHDHLGMNDVPPCSHFPGQTLPCLNNLPSSATAHPSLHEGVAPHPCLHNGEVHPCLWNGESAHPFLQDSQSCELGLPEHQNALCAPIVPEPSSSVDSPAAHVCRWSSCGQSFASLDELTQHLTEAHVGSGKTSYDCFWQDCNRHSDNGFTSKQKLCRHLQSHTGHRPFQCKVCQQNFSEAATLQQHMRRHTQEKPYLCDYPGCGKSFAITGALTIHKRTHNGEKPFKCPHCDKAFSESSNLSKHLRTHTGAKPYTCNACNKSFARADQLTRHARVHNKQT
ncbi:hypothetical protein C8R47DRAFT_1143753 [Mycena vitilis]|nr:hypothetical protein C8R47DRAFT_1143753 [Mycena vitilis]